MTELTEWLRQYKWTHYCTLTFRFGTNPQTAQKEFARYIRCLEQRSQHRVDWFNTVETGVGGQNHIHALLNVDLPTKALQEAWRSGYVKIRRYNKRRGAPEYTAKQFENCDMSKQLTHND